jgi:hypothetical protein
MDGDGFGDNGTGRLPDAFPLRFSQKSDSDGDGYGDNFTEGAWQPDECGLEYGTSTIDYFGCKDYDSDGVSDATDPCPYDPNVWQGITGQVKCGAVANDHDGDGIPNDIDEDYTGAAADGDGLSTGLLVLLGLIVFLLAIIMVAMMAKQAGKRKAVFSRVEEMKVAAEFEEEEARRLEWIDHYVAQGDYESAIGLGWVQPDEVPQWKQHQQQQEEAEEEAIPTMLSLDDLL